MWFGHLASLDGVHSALTSLLQPLGAALYPPLNWDSLIERKDKIYAIFHSYMLPTTWIPEEGKSAQTLQAELLGGKTDGRYRIKGACSCCGKCGATIDIQAGACPALQAEAARFVLESHQPSIGIQPFIDSFPSSELRFWTVADRTASAGHPRFRSTNILLKTGADLDRANSDGIPFTAEVYAAVHDDSLACSKLIDRMQHEQAAFLNTSTSWASAASASTWGSTLRRRLPSSTSSPLRPMATAGAKCTSKTCCGSWARRWSTACAGRFDGFRCRRRRGVHTTRAPDLALLARMSSGCACRRPIAHARRPLTFPRAAAFGDFERGRAPSNLHRFSRMGGIPVSGQANTAWTRKSARPCVAGPHPVSRSGSRRRGCVRYLMRGLLLSSPVAQCEESERSIKPLATRLFHTASLSAKSAGRRSAERELDANDEQRVVAGCAADG